MRLLSWTALLLLAAAPAVAAENDTKEEKPAVLDHTMKTLEGKEIDLGKKYDGKVVMIVNVASEYGLTPQYEQLQALHEKYGEEGLAIIGFPCNQFGKQEPGTAQEIREFCTQNYGVTFDIMAKVEVNGDGQCELYRELTQEEAGAKFPGKITWNFEKFIVGKDGSVVARFAPRTRPDDGEVTKVIETQLKK